MHSHYLVSHLEITMSYSVKLVSASRRSNSTSVADEKSEDSFLKWFLLLIPVTTFSLGTWQVLSILLTSGMKANPSSMLCVNMGDLSLGETQAVEAEADRRAS